MAMDLNNKRTNEAYATAARMAANAKFLATAATQKALTTAVAAAASVQKFIIHLVRSSSYL